MHSEKKNPYERNNSGQNAVLEQAQQRRDKGINEIAKYLQQYIVAASKVAVKEKEEAEEKLWTREASAARRPLQYWEKQQAQLSKKKTKNRRRSAGGSTAGMRKKREKNGAILSLWRACTHGAYVQRARRQLARRFLGLLEAERV